MADAILRTLGRLFITHRNMLRVGHRGAGQARRRPESLAHLPAHVGGVILAIAALVSVFTGGIRTRLALAIPFVAAVDRRARRCAAGSAFRLAIAGRRTAFSGETPGLCA